MRIVNKPTAELKPYDKNAKKHDKKQIANVAESIKQFGFVQPIVLDKDNNVIIGHCRLEAAKKLHLAEVPCVMADDLTDEQAKKLRLLDNKLNESDWDIDIIADEIADLDLDDFDIPDFTSQTMNYLDILQTDEKSMSNQTNVEKDYFEISFVFNIEKRAEVEKAMKSKGKAYWVVKLLKLFEQENTDD